MYIYLFIYILKIVHAKNAFFGKLALECEDEILNTREILIFDREVANKKIFAFFTLFYWLLYAYY